MATAQAKGAKRVRVSPSTKGAIGEHIATAWLLARGYDVFRNVSPNGRADLLAVDWDADETFRVDVKSEGFTLEDTANGHYAKSSRKRDELNAGFGIRYLVVCESGSCHWYEKSEKVASNDNEKKDIAWWVCKKTGQRFPEPGNYMKNNQWTYFCFWLLRSHPDLIFPHSEQFVRSCSSRGIGNDNPRLTVGELKALDKLYHNVYQKLKSLDAVRLIQVEVA